MSWVKKRRCNACGIVKEDNQYIFKDCFENGWVGGNLGENHTRGCSIGDFGSLRYCQWDIEKVENNLYNVNNSKAKLIIITNMFSDKRKEHHIIDFKEFETHIEVIDIDGNRINLCCCDPIYIEWLDYLD